MKYEVMLEQGPRERERESHMRLLQHSAIRGTASLTQTGEGRSHVLFR